MAPDHLSTYQSNAVTQADPVKLVELLFEGAIRFINRAHKALDDGDMEGAHNNILRGYAIVAELIATLDFEKGGEIAKGLEQCYDYILFVLKEANIKKDPTELDKALSLLEPLLSGWKNAFTGKTTALAENGNGANDFAAQDQTPRHSPLNIVG